MSVNPARIVTEDGRLVHQNQQVTEHESVATVGISPGWEMSECARTSVPLEETWGFCAGMEAPDRRLVFRPSASAEIANIFARLKHRRGDRVAGSRHLAIY